MVMKSLSAPRRVVTGILAGVAVFGLAVSAQQKTDPQAAVDSAFKQFQNLKEGKNADYIPALAKVDPNLFGIALVTVDGKVFTAGDVKTEVSIQSISKVFTMAQVIQEQGLEAIEKRIGVDATGARFNSIIAIEGVRSVVGTGAPEMNALVNPGAISSTSMVLGSNADAIWAKILGFHNDAAGRTLTVLQDVYKSESDSNQRNQAIGALMFAYGYIKTDWRMAVDLYTRQCSIGVNARDLATMAATLAAGGKNPVTGKQIMDVAKVPGVLAVMATAGLYDDSGKWLYHTGLPAKSGVGGGLIAVSPGKFGIAVVAPPLDDAGNSVKGQRAITADLECARRQSAVREPIDHQTSSKERRRTMPRVLFALTVAALLTGTTGAFAQDVRYNFDKEAQFANFKTYKWVEIKGAEQPPNQIVNGQIQAAVDTELATKGLTRTESDGADLYIGYQLAVSTEKQYTSFDSGWGYGPGWYGGGWYGGGGGMTTGTTSTIYIGQIALDMYQPAAKKLVWRGTASKTIDTRAKPDKQQKNLQKAMAKLLKNFPPPVKKSS